MGAGLSMASVNKIKELANSREYSLALELVEHQDLTKSLNPQFLRLCGEIYIKNNRYADARRCLLMAHRLAPESKRIIYTFVELYLRMGYFQLAKTYYDMYMFDASAYDSREIEYIWNKHEHPEDYRSLDALLDGYMHNLDYEWSFELYLLYKKEGKQTEADTLAELYHASYQNSENSQIIADIESGKVTVDTYFDVYASEEQPDDDPDMESLRVEEKELLAADDLRMHPKEAEITVMYEDSYTPAGSEKKVQKMLKKQEREEQRKEKKLQKKLKQQEKEEAEAAAAEANEKVEKTSAVTEENTEAEKASTVTEEKAEAETTTAETETKTETSSTTAVEESSVEENDTATEEQRKDDKDVQAETVETENAQDSEKQTEEEKTAAFDEFWNAEDDTEEKPKEKKRFFDKFRRKKKTSREESEEIEKKETEQESGQTETSEKTETVDEKDTAEQEETKNTEENTKETKSEESNIESSSENIETTGQADDMIHRKNIISKDAVVVDEDDGFEAEAETVEELEAKEQSKSRNESSETGTTVSKPAFEFQTVDLAPEDFDDEYQVDDFSEKIDEEFGEMKTVETEKPFDIGELTSNEPEIEEAVEEVVEEPEAEETVEEPVEDPVVEETVEPAVDEPEIEEVEEAVEEPVPDEIEEESVEETTIEETVELAVDEPEIEEVEEVVEEPVSDEIEEESVEETTIAETVEPAVDEPEIEEVEEVIEEPVSDEIVEETVEELVSDETEEESVEETEKPEVDEPENEEIEEVVEEPEVDEIVDETVEEPEIEETVEPEVEEPEMEDVEEEPEFHVAPFTTKPEKKKLDFPVFKSSLFPDYHKETKVVENNFDEIMEEAQDKMTENMRKEEQMQREAEALLASLGISMDSIPATPKAEKKEEQPVQKGPSRDELKASLKIDSVKKNLLKRVKEYR